MLVSIGGYSFHSLFLEGKMDVFGYLETVRYRYRLDSVDLWNAQIAERTRPLLTLFDESALRRVKKALDERSLNLVNLAVDTAHLWDPDPDVREQLHQNALAHLRAAVLLGAKTVRIDTCSQGQQAFTEEALDFIVRRYREYCRFAAEYGMRIGPENHMGPSLVPAEMVKLAQAINDPAYGILLHIGRWTEQADQGDAMVAPWVVHTHLDRKAASLPDAADRIRTLRKTGYTGHWGIEYNPPAHTAYAEIELLLATVKRLLLDVELSEGDMDIHERT